MFRGSGIDSGVRDAMPEVLRWEREFSDGV